MRLLVYGGNQHGERRRIGEWPDEIASQVFQDTYGSSMRNPSFGVGLLDDRPFLILRKIENFGDRAYPLVILFDPARDTWEHFNWNGAHLLWSLYGTMDSPGIKLLTDPESFHTDEHLAQLLAEIDQSIPANDKSSEITEPERLLDLWSGAVFANSALIAPVNPQVTGFSSRPDLTSLSALISKLPSSLRCGKGWLFGGRDRHAEALGTHLVFDDGKLDPPTDSEKASFIEFQHQGHQLRTALETLSQSADYQTSQLRVYLSQPIWKTLDDATLKQSLQALRRSAEAAGLNDSTWQRQLREIRDQLERALSPELREKLAEFGYLPEGDVGIASNDYLEGLDLDNDLLDDLDGGGIAASDEEMAEAIAALRGDHVGTGVAGGEEELPHRGGEPHAHGHDVVRDELHGVVDRHAGVDGAAGRVDVEPDVGLGILRVEQQHLRADRVGVLVADLGAEEHDPLSEQALVDVVVEIVRADLASHARCHLCVHVLDPSGAGRRTRGEPGRFRYGRTTRPAATPKLAAGRGGVFTDDARPQP